MSVRISTTDGTGITLDPHSFGRMMGSLGDVLTPTSPGYDQARSIWNGMVDRRPAVIVRCHTRDDVIRAIRLARDRNLLVAIRGGGHNIAGSAMVDDGMVIDLSPMKAITVDRERKTARVEPGVTLGELDRETQKYGLATPVGINSTTGIAGLTLGGGFGWTTRKFGLTVDNLLSAEVVTAEGLTMIASAHENPDLFWAIRGGGGNFGVVTSFEFRLHEIGPDVLAGLIVHPFADARALLLKYREVMAKAPDELTAWVVLRKAPPLPFLPPAVHGTPVVVFAALYTGNMEEGADAMQPLRSIGKPIADVISPHKFTDFQAAFDPLLTPGARNYWKSNNFLSLSDGVIDTVLEHVARLPDDQCEVFLGHLGGAAKRIPATATAYAPRDAEFIMNVHGRWADADKDSDCIAWARDLYTATAPFATGGVYVNFITGDEADRVKAAYGPNYDRLRMLKRRFDPTNLFRTNQNLRPAALE
jgi:FAD/FMN-containing dehydrogenase